MMMSKPLMIYGYGKLETRFWIAQEIAETKFKHDARNTSAPTASETISYQMPTFRLNRVLVHFAVHKKHIGFYPTPSAITKFSKELENYEFSKGSIKFPINKPIPWNLIKRIVEFRVKENTTK